jgi:hypothetical protein
VVGGRLQRAVQVTAAEVDQETEGLLRAPARPPPPTLTAPEAEGVEDDENNNTEGQGAAAAAPKAVGGAPAKGKEAPNAQVAMDTAVEFDTANIHFNQLNCHHSRDVHTSLELAVTEEQLVLYLLQEPYNYERNPCGLTKLYLHYLPDVNAARLYMRHLN